MILHDVAVTMDSQRMLCVGTLTASSEGLHPKKSRKEKQIIGTPISFSVRHDSDALVPLSVYNLEKFEIER